MRNCVISAAGLEPDMPVHFFLGWHDRATTGTTRWTWDRRRARRFAEDEAQVESSLIALVCPRHVITVEDAVLPAEARRKPAD